MSYDDDGLFNFGVYNNCKDCLHKLLFRGEKSINVVDSRINSISFLNPIRRKSCHSLFC